MAQTKPPGRKADHHPIISALSGRDPWTPRPFTRTISRFSAGTRAIADQVNPRAEEWRSVTAAALASDLPLWVVLGDSIAQGVGATSIEHSWVARIAGALAADGRPHAIVNLSLSGARSSHVDEEQLPLLELLEREPALVTCGVGSNDLMRNPHPAAVSAGINRVIDQLPTGTIVSTLPTPAASPTGRWINRSVRNHATRRDMVLADVVPHLVGGRKGWASDRFHPNDLGYSTWVAAHAPILGLEPAHIPDRWDPRAA